MPIRNAKGQYVPGVSGNPTGSLKGYVRFADMLKRELATTDRRKRTRLQIIAERVVRMAMAGDMDAVRWIADRVDGRVAQTLDVNSQHQVNVVPWLPAAQEAVERLRMPELEELEGAEVVSVDGVDGVDGGDEPADRAD